MINIEKLKNYIYENQLLFIFLVALFFISFYFMSEKMILLMILIFVFYFAYHHMQDDISEQTFSKKNTSIIENNIRYTGDVIIHSTLKPIINELHHFKKYNPSSYKDGYKNIRMFSLLISDLEKDHIHSWRQYIENAENYLMKSVNDFQSIGISVPEENYSDILKYNQITPNKLQKKIGELCKKLYLNGSYLMINLSEKLNKKLDGKLNRFQTPLHIDFIKGSNSHLNEYDLY